MDIRLNKDTIDKFKIAVASYIEDSKDDPESFRQLSTWVQKQPDLLYALSILVSAGANKNMDGFLVPILCDIYKSPRHKYVDYEHDAEGLNVDGKNPDKYQTVGHIYDSAITLQSGEIIPESEIIKDPQDNKWFLSNSQWRNKPIDIVVAWVVYKFLFPEIAEKIIKYSEIDPITFGVSMEILFNDYKFRVGDFDIFEEFDFDANTIGAIEEKRDTKFGKILESMWKSKLKYKGQSITRILGGDIFFSGMAITSNRANKRSANLSIALSKTTASFINEQDRNNKELEILLKSVATKNNGFDLSKCNIVDGQPDCDCLKVFLIAELNDLEKQAIDVFSSFANDPVKKHVDVGGIDISIEWLKGEDRKYKNDFVSKMHNDYGYITNTKSVFDGEDIDCYIGENLNSLDVYRISQLRDGGIFDEYKFMVGFNSQEEAKQAYLNHMPISKCGEILILSLEKFKEISQSSNELK